MENDSFFHGLQEDRTSEMRPFSIKQSDHAEQADDIFGHLQSEDDLVAKLTQRNRKVVLQSTERMSSKQQEQVQAYSRQIQEEADRELDKQLMATESYDFGQHFNLIEDYQEKPRIALGTKAPVQPSEKSFQVDEHQETDIALPMSYTPSKQSPHTKTIEPDEASQDFDSGSSKEDNYFAGLQKDTPNNFKQESPEEP